MRSQLLLKIEILFDEICRVSRLGIAAKSKLHLLGSLMELHRISEILKQGSFLENSIKSKKLAGNLHKQLKNQAVSTRVPVKEFHQIHHHDHHFWYLLFCLNQELFSN